MKKIVLIDDDRDDAELFKEALSEIDASAAFQHYEESKQALKELLGKQSDLPDFIFLDINMPVISGWQCLSEFKNDAQLNSVPIIIFTTSSQGREKEMAMERGADGFITKPGEYSKLKSLIASVLVCS